MTKLITFAIAIAAAAPAVAAPANSYSFSEAGHTYSVSEQTVGNATVLTGQDEAGRKFKLRIVADRVTGHYNGTPMSFRAPAAGAAQIASR